jgi:hypothetical protein
MKRFDHGAMDFLSLAIRPPPFQGDGLSLSRICQPNCALTIFRKACQLLEQVQPMSRGDRFPVPRSLQLGAKLEHFAGWGHGLGKPPFDLEPNYLLVQLGDPRCRFICEAMPRGRRDFAPLIPGLRAERTG